MGVIVQTKELMQSVIASVVAGVGVTFAFSVAIWGAARFVDLSRSERRAAAAGAAAIGALALALTFAAIVVGIVVMTSK
jgi:hypothetical protein